MIDKKEIKRTLIIMLQKPDKTFNKYEQNTPLRLSIANHAIISRLTDTQDEFLHSHEFFEIILIRYGSITHCIGGNKEIMQVGDACIVAPNTQHSFIRKGDCAHRDVMMSATLFKKTCDFLDIDLYDKLLETGFVKFNIGVKKIEDFENSYLAFTEMDDENTLKIYAKTIACQLISALYTNTQTVSSGDVFKSKCITIINENYAKKDILNILLSELGYTQGHFCKKFKNAFQITPIEYINRRKIISAASNLVLTNYSIEECCHLVGFDSLPHFIKLFKEHYGTTPTKYRRAYRLISNGNQK